MPMQPKKKQNYYEMLGLPVDATSKQIKKAYHKISLKKHPDKITNPSDEDRDFYTSLTEGYNILKDPCKKRLYDLLKVAKPKPPYHKIHPQGWNAYKVTRTWFIDYCNCKRANLFDFWGEVYHVTVSASQIAIAKGPGKLANKKPDPKMMPSDEDFGTCEAV